MYIDPVTGAPLFVLDQMMLVSEINKVYHKYGIHGIYYAVLFGWPGSPYATITDDVERDKLVKDDVYTRTHYDPIRKEEMSPKSSHYYTKQYDNADMKKAMSLIAKLARIPIVEEKLKFMEWLDNNTVAMDSKVNPNNPKGVLDRAKEQGDLLKHRNVLSKGLEEVMAKEKEILQKKDPLCSLDDFLH